MTTRNKRHKRIRAKISGTPGRPRVVVFRSLKHIHLQAIDDTKGTTIAAATDLKSKKPAEELAKKLTLRKIKKVVFDRGGYKYHGKVKNIAEELRKQGLEF